MVKELVYDKKAMVSVTKTFTFDSAHNLIDYKGKCEKLHGHTYHLEVTVTGFLGEKGMVMDFVELKKLVNDLVINKLDHEYLNNIFEFNPTAENMCVRISDILEMAIAKYNENSNTSVSLSKITLWETPDSYATYTL